MAQLPAVVLCTIASLMTVVACGATEGAGPSQSGSGGDAGADGRRETGSGQGGADQTDANEAGARQGGSPNEDDNAGGMSGSAGAASSNEDDGIGELGAPCSRPGALACNARHQKVAVVCDGSVWVVRDTCKSGEFCDASPGLDVGLCKPQLAECAGHEPGYEFCDDQQVARCSEDNVSRSVVETCSLGCEAGACLEPPGPEGNAPECPLGQIGEDWLNCARDCGGTGGALGYCSDLEATGGVTWDPSEGGVLRLPFAMDVPACGAGERRLVAVYYTSKVSRVLRVRAAGNWWVSTANAVPLGGDQAGCDGGKVRCRVLPATSKDTDFEFWFLSDNAAGLPENVTIEVVSSDATCD